jgi:hypothetical protein
MSTKSLLTKTVLTLSAAAVLAPLGAVAASAAVAPPLKPAVTALVLRDNRALDANQVTGKVTVTGYQGRWDFNRSQDFRLVYGPAGKMAYIQYIGPGKYYGDFVQTSDRHAPGIPPWANYGYAGSKLVHSQFAATIFTVTKTPRGEVLSVQAVPGPRGHAAERLTGEIFGQLGLNTYRMFQAPTNAQLFAERIVIPAHR